MRKQRLLGLALAALLSISALHAEEAVPTPEFFGIYIVSNDELVEPRDAVGEKRMRTLGSLMSSREGIHTLSGLSIDPDGYFLLYGPEASGLIQARLGRLRYVHQLETGTGLITDPKRVHNARMWILTEDVPTRVGPVREVPDLYKLVPADPLGPGVYALYYGSLGSSVPLEGARLALDFRVGASEEQHEDREGSAATAPGTGSSSQPSSSGSETLSTPPTVEESYDLQVEHVHDRIFFTGKCEGTLHIDTEGVVFRAEKDSFELPCSDITSLRKATASVWPSALSTKKVQVPCIEVRGTVDGERKKWQFIPVRNAPFDHIVSREWCQK